ncbi:ABC transporter permease [Devosia sp. CN2-171]|uniref:ABC transporter permease n=1 Tax=Devosia sp. CN2-171 TaxID=3400909 RepID=UPI003BF83721
MSTVDHPPEAKPRQLHEITIARRRRAFPDLIELWQHREIVYFLALRDITVRYRQAVLGILWVVIQPLVSMGVFTLVFDNVGGITTGTTPYPLFVLAGLVPWSFFARSVTGMTGSLTSNAALVGKVYFSRLAIPLAVIMGAGVDLAVGCVVLFAAILISGQPISPAIAVLPVFLALLAIGTTGVGLLMAATNVRFRDVGHMVPFALQTLLFLTPVIYPASLLPSVLQPFAALNPMFGVVEGMRWSVLGIVPDWSGVAISAISAVVFVVAGLFVFARVERTFADIV